MIIKAGTKLRALQEKGIGSAKIEPGDILTLIQDFDTEGADGCPHVVNSLGYSHNAWYITRYEVISAKWEVGYSRIAKFRS